MDDLYLVFEELYLTTNAAQVSVEGCFREQSLKRNGILFTILGSLAYFFVQLTFTVSSENAPQSHLYGLTAIVPLLTPAVMKL